MRAIVRRPSWRLDEGEVTHIERTPLDLERALAQHDAYVALLRHHGVDVVWAPELDHHPDGVFVEDTVVIVDGFAVLTRPGAVSRRGEVDSIAGVVAELGLPSGRIEPPGTVDGGDVLVTRTHVFVGRTTRTDDAGIEQLARLASAAGRPTVAVEVSGCLHLKTAVTMLPDGALVAVPGWVDRAIFERRGHRVIDAADPSGGDVLCLESTVVLPADAVATADVLRAAGYGVELIDVGELQKVEAGVTCMSVLLDA